MVILNRPQDFLKSTGLNFKYLILLLLPVWFICFPGCEEAQADYRDPFTGKFVFTSVSYWKQMCYDTTEADCIDFWRYSIPDTAIYTSEITKLDSIRLIIKFAETYFGQSIPLEIRPVVSENGVFSEAHVLSDLHLGCEGGFVDFDTLKMVVGIAEGMGGQATYLVEGVRYQIP